MKPRLFHFSDDATIQEFVPKALRVPSQRKEDMDWLNGPLVWAIDDWHQPMYFFPRDCPRILLWRLPNSTMEDVDKYFAGTDVEIVAYVEQDWLERIRSEVLYRYEFPTETFLDLEDAGMWVSKQGVTHLDLTEVTNLDTCLKKRNVELRPLSDLLTLKNVWQSSLHVSGIRLRNAEGW